MSNRYLLVIVCGVNLFKEKKNWGKAARERELLAPGLILLSDPALLPADPDDP